jgi:Right handed beta helix region
MKTSKYAISILLLVIIFSKQLYSQATRTWVSGVGDDANPCSRTAPCKTFAGAISKTAAGGEISVLDPGGYGAVTITKSITIDGLGNLSSILASGTNGININAGASDYATIRNISLNGIGTGLSGIRFTSGKHLIVENCVITGFSSFGINADRTAVGVLTVKNTTITGPLATSSGISLTTTLDTLRATLENVLINGVSTGILASTNAVVNIQNSNLSQNQIAINAKNTAIVNVESSSISNNKTGVLGENTSIVRLSNNTILNNSVAGIAINDTGKVISFGNNRLAGNTTNAPMGVISQQ